MTQCAAALCQDSSHLTVQRLHRISLQGPWRFLKLHQEAHLTLEAGCKTSLPAAMHYVLLALIFWGSAAWTHGLKYFSSLHLLSICISPSACPSNPQQHSTMDGWEEVQLKCTIASQGTCLGRRELHPSIHSPHYIQPEGWLVIHSAHSLDGESDVYL